jgi:hypothetical protein
MNMGIQFGFVAVILSSIRIIVNPIYHSNNYSVKHCIMPSASSSSIDPNAAPLSSHHQAAFDKCETKVVVWKMRVQLALQRMTLLEANLQSAYALIKGQSSKPILEKVEAQENYADIHARRDPMGLLTLIKGVLLQFEERQGRDPG